MGELRVPPSGTIVVTASIALALLLGASGWRFGELNRPLKTSSAERAEVVYVQSAQEKNGAEVETAWQELMQSTYGIGVKEETEQKELSPDAQLLSGAESAIALQLLGQYVAL